jgi:3D (Asp-Asp-Asp) domain-containing protein
MVCEPCETKATPVERASPRSSRVRNRKSESIHPETGEDDEGARNLLVTRSARGDYVIVTPEDSCHDRDSRGVGAHGQGRPPEAKVAEARRLSRTTAALFSVLIGACGSPSPPVGAAGDAAVGTPGDAASEPSPGNRGDADIGDADMGADGSSALDSSPTSDAGPAPADAGADSPADAGEFLSVYATFYGWADNSPPGGAIAYPKSDGNPTVHDTAGGSGTYADPITFATDKAEFPIGTVLYVPFIEKYVVMEDDCVECDSDWTSAHKWHIDLWMNSNGTESTSALTSCEDRWTRTSTQVEVDPPAGRTVTPNPLFDPSTNTCRTTP